MGPTRIITRTFYGFSHAALHLTDEEVARRLRAGHKITIRLNDTVLPDRQPTRDLVFGGLFIPLDRSYSPQIRLIPFIPPCFRRGRL
ncbi:hypothetical protein M378DRAFT_164668 [Amanita muscaria Koide BX008]|uniref:Uncharacterized protein n=1 Tax=Amanita muscaria (strain Koide BX008) TaxID=946122 RepID=A0A0C2WP02_AMAMK|nr:hypothetical protein M378DRAFT_164668 [Amanita muscaria Koide BX008]